MPGGTLYVTLEPCSTHGKTPPCTDLILNSGLERVVVGARDPNPKHRGSGIEVLRSSGLKIKTGVLQAEVRRQNASFFRMMDRTYPFVTLKLAQSLDGKIATARGESKWISSAASRRKVQELRRDHEAVLVGTNTLKSDKPGLRLRGTKGKDPRRIFIVRRPGELKRYLSAEDREGDILFHQKTPSFKLRHAKTIKAPFTRRGILLSFLMRSLAKERISSLLIEGGGEMAASFLEGGWVDRVYFFIAPIIIGGSKARTGVEGEGVKRLHHALHLKEMKIERSGKDILIRGKLK
jgi:diaminohydroxyphosphoribosylaminopyrimidine deaminase/5-amino-6-(5-phosphoribosylamino)uracil reductase